MIVETIIDYHQLSYRLKGALQWFIGSFGTCIMPISQALYLSLQIWRFGLHFARPIPELFIITNHMVEMIYVRWRHLLTQPHKLLQYADAIEKAGAVVDNCWGFVDGTVRPVCRPNEYQRAINNGHKRVPSIKFQTVALPNGLVRNLFGPVEGAMTVIC